MSSIKIRIMILILSFITIFLASCETQQGIEKEVGSTSPKEVINSFKLCEEYDKNEVAADLTFKDKVLYVVGPIKTIGVEVMGNPYISLAPGLTCYFSEAHKTEIANLRKGQMVGTKGRCKGKTLGLKFRTK